LQQQIFINGAAASAFSSAVVGESTLYIRIQGKLENIVFCCLQMQWENTNDFVEKMKFPYLETDAEFNYMTKLLKTFCVFKALL
jgi:hypothetical protein